MPVISSDFHPPPILRNGHVQTLLPVLLPRWVKGVVFERERFELEDGDFLDFDWVRAGHNRVAILMHGLEGGSSGGNVRGMARTLVAAGWDVLALNFRGCSGEPNRLPRAYHSGDTEDLRVVIQRAAEVGYGRMALVGFSLGGNIALKYLGEPTPHPAVTAAVAISAPVDLAPCARVLDQAWSNRIYLLHFLMSLAAKMEAKAERFPTTFNAQGVRAMRSFREFDDRFTAPLHGFRDADDYWERSSARPYLPRITVPALILVARNDPFLAEEAFPWEEAAENPCVFLETPDSGGHAGFMDLKHGLQPWSERRVAEFLDDCFVTKASALE